MVTRLRHLSIVQFALVAAVLYALIGILIGLFWWLVLSPIMIAGMKTTAMPTPGSLAVMSGMGFMAVIFFPIFYGVVGFIGGLIFATLYNVVAGWTGGIEMRLETVVAPETPGSTVATV